MPKKEVRVISPVILSLGSLLLTSGAFAQIPVTGGRLTGEAAFFSPVSGDTRIFDVAPRTLRLETPNGVTVDSRLSPTFGRLDATGNRLPASGDRGLINGLLSGRAFDVGGNPFFFTDVPTSFNFSVNSFVPSTGSLQGTLIEPVNPAAASRAFVPVLGVSLNPASEVTFDAVPGTLASGALDANLFNGSIALPSVARLGTPLVNEFAVPDTPVVIERRFNFRLEGVGDPNPPGTIGDPLGSFFDPFFAGGVRFSSSQAVTNFLLQIDGTPLAISGSGTFGTAIEIQGINPLSTAASAVLPGNNPFAPAVAYVVEGQGSGVASNFEPLSFSSGNSATTFSFTDQTGAFVQGLSQGATAFSIAGAQPFTVSSFTGFVPSDVSNAFELASTGTFTAAAVVPPVSLVGSGPPSSNVTTPNSGGATGINVIPTVGATRPSTTDAPPQTTFAFQQPPVAVTGLPAGSFLSQLPTGQFIANVPVGPTSRVMPTISGTQQIAITGASGNSDWLVNGTNPTIGDLLYLTNDQSSPLNQVVQPIGAIQPNASVSSSDQAFGRLLSGQSLTTSDLLSINQNLGSVVQPIVAPSAFSPSFILSNPSGNSLSFDPSSLVSPSQGSFQDAINNAINNPTDASSVAPFLGLGLSQSQLNDPLMQQALQEASGNIATGKFGIQNPISDSIWADSRQRHANMLSRDQERRAINNAWYASQGLEAPIFAP